MHMVWNLDPKQRTTVNILNKLAPMGSAGHPERTDTLDSGRIAPGRRTTTRRQCFCARRNISRQGSALSPRSYPPARSLKHPHGPRTLISVVTALSSLIPKRASSVSPWSRPSPDCYEDARTQRLNTNKVLYQCRAQP